MRPSSVHRDLVLVFAALVIAAGFGCGDTFAQSSSNTDSLIPGRSREDDQPRSVKEFLAKQRTEKDKKDYEELLERGEQLAAISDQLETEFLRNNQLSSADQAKLQSLEKLVSKIRKELGADDDDPEDEDEEVLARREPSSIREAFTNLKEVTGNLLDELKKSTRFTISAVAIQSSNSVLKLVRFLRLKR